jgi:hypothetical protein
MRMANVKLARPEACFDPEAVIILSASLEDAWNRLLRSGSECTRPAYARAMREVLAKRIFDLAQRGVIDQKELADGAVRFLAANYRYASIKGRASERIFATSQQRI